MKNYHCCIPGCDAYDTLANFLIIPTIPYWREKWLAAIPRKDWVADSSTVACKKHFKQVDSAVFSTVKMNKNDKDYIKKGVMCTKAVPSMFPHRNPHNPEIDPDLPPDMFELYSRDCQGPETFGDLENSDSDFIVDYWFFKLMHPERLRSFMVQWKTVSNNDYTIFYTMDFSEIPRILASVKVDNILRVSITLAGRHMDPLDLTWILPISGKLNRWSQLKVMLTIFGK